MTSGQPQTSKLQAEFERAAEEAGVEFPEDSSE
jgi:hypothetical protein